MTTAEMLEARGEVLGRADTLLDFLDFRFGPLPEDTTQTVREASSDQLKRWSTRAKTVAALDEVFA